MAKKDAIKHVERYGEMVWENTNTEKYRKSECMCLKCGNMKPRSPDHCKIASEFYQICKKNGCAFIMTRCGSWTKGKE